MLSTMAEMMSTVKLAVAAIASISLLVGGAVGIALGVGLGAAGASMLGYPARPSVAAMLLAAGFCIMRRLRTERRRARDDHET